MSLLPQTVEYGLRSVAYLARRFPEGARAADIAKVADVPPQYLKKLLRRLVVAEILAARRGHGGGFVLARRPDEVTFFDVMTALDFDLAHDRCLFGWKTCDAAVPCPLHGSWGQLKVMLREWAAASSFEGAPH